MQVLPTLQSSLLHQQVSQLTQAFRQIAATRMHGMPLLNPALQVAAIDFEAVASEAADGRDALAGVGILLTPWFMNLIWLPLQGQAALAVGRTEVRRIGASEFVFIGAHDDGVGAFEMCSLFSPMFEFADQETACETARQALAFLRQRPVQQAASEPGPNARRAFLFGRGAVQS